jgi:hypothetical protein
MTTDSFTLVGYCLKGMEVDTDGVKCLNLEIDMGDKTGNALVRLDSDCSITTDNVSDFILAVTGYISFDGKGAMSLRAKSVVRVCKPMKSDYDLTLDGDFDL